MNKLFYIYLLGFCFFFFQPQFISTVRGQGINTQFDQFPLSSIDANGIIRLTKTLIIPGTEKILIDSIQLTRKSEYDLDFSQGELILKITRDKFKQNSVLYCLYSYLPFEFKSNYRHRNVVLLPLQKGERPSYVAQTPSPLTMGGIFGSDIQKSGSIFRGFTVGSNRDLTLNSGFRLQMAGKLAQDVDIAAALTDENTSLQPEGNTQTLQEFDNIYIQINSTNYGATLGDFYFSLDKGEFARVHRKLQGAQGVGEYQSAEFSTKNWLMASSARGKFHSVFISGVEGVQGPYRLFGKNNEKNIIVIAGTEKVYLDGEQLIRGESNDYSIDYGTSEITFSSRRLVTSASRIVVDFEYSDRNYTRNFASVQSSNQIFSKKVDLTATYLREGDDQDLPIDINLSDSDKKIIRKSGANQPIKSGVIFAGRDSVTGLGKGQYAKSDTVIQGDTITVYRYAPGESAALYNVAFSFVGYGKGNYQRQMLGRYVFTGQGNGSYKPVITLPLAELHQLIDFQATVPVTNAFRMETEYAASTFNPNRLSSDSNIEQVGSAFTIKGQYKPVDIRFGSMSIGSFDLAFSERYLEKTFQPIDRIDDIEFNRKWSLDSTVTIQPSAEEIRELSAFYKPFPGVSIGGGAGTHDRKGQFFAERRNIVIQSDIDTFPHIDYLFESVLSTDKPSNIESNWIRHKGQSLYSHGIISPAFRFENEKRLITNLTNDSLQSASFSFTTYAPKISLVNILGMNAGTEYEWRNDKGVSGGTLHSQSSSVTQNYFWEVTEINNFSSSINIIKRVKRFEQAFAARQQNINTLLFRSTSRYSPFERAIDADLFYEVITQRTSKLERVYVKVRKGEGQYVWIDGNHNGVVDISDDGDFKLTRYDGEYSIISVPGDQLFPVIDLKSAFRVRLVPARLIRMPASWWEWAVKEISTESFVRIEERSTEPEVDRIYTLQLSYFLRPVTTMLGRQTIQQDLFLFENNPSVSVRMRYLQREGLGQYSTGLEHSYDRERSVRIRTQLAADLSQQLDYVNKQNNVAASSTADRSHDITSSMVASDLSYRPEQNLEIGMRLELSQSTDNFPLLPSVADFNTEAARLVIGFLGNGQARFDLSREEIQLDRGSRLLKDVPYVLTGGRETGKTYLWSTAIEYRISNNIQGSLQYNGRKEGDRIPIHSGRAEIRAFF